MIIKRKKEKINNDSNYNKGGFWLNEEHKFKEKYKMERLLESEELYMKIN